MPADSGTKRNTETWYDNQRLTRLASSGRRSDNHAGNGVDVVLESAPEFRLPVWTR
jgi:hypothetical protein